MGIRRVAAVVAAALLVLVATGCTSSGGGGGKRAPNPGHRAAQTFGSAAHPLTDEDGDVLDPALRISLCPPK